MASSPSFVGLNKPVASQRPAAGSGAGPVFPQAPDVTLPLRFLVSGILSLFVGLIILALRPDFITGYHYHQHIVAVTHLLLLGFGLTVVMGATYQLVPVILETPLHSERLARWHFPIHLISVAGMVWMFWVWDMKQLGHFGSGLALGIGFYIYNITRTLLRADRWTVVAAGVASSLLWLALVATAGLAIAAGKCTYEMVDRPDLPALLTFPLAGLKALASLTSRFEAIALMHAHAHLGILGVFVILTVGVAYKLVPMFLISDVQNQRRAWTSLLLLNLGLAISFLTIATQSRGKPLGALIIAAGLALFARELMAIVAARRRRVIDWGLTAFLMAQAVLLPVTALGAILSWPGLPLTEGVGRLENAYGFLAILGVLAFAIIGMMQKILPFLVWFAAYSKEVGRSRTPALTDMYSTRLQSAITWAWVAGLTLATTGILANSTLLARLGIIALVASMGAFFVNAVLILRHLVRPQLSPLQPHRPQPPRKP
jgi:hypothetical protein